MLAGTRRGLYIELDVSVGPREGKLSCRRCELAPGEGYTTEEKCKGLCGTEFADCRRDGVISAPPIDEYEDVLRLKLS